MIRLPGERASFVQGAGVRRADAERIHAGVTRGTAAQNEAAGGRGVPVLQSAGKSAGSMGRRAEADKMKECRWGRN